MKRFNWISRLSFFGGFLTYMGASFGGHGLMPSLEKALLATVVLYGLGVFGIMAYYQISLRVDSKPEESQENTDSGTPPGHGTDGASWEGEQASTGNSLQQ
ncbi:hypothetical protein H8E52_09120 [bacterium]|nr:hypothetical protein [bacterium]